jgi:hypothetical protein
MTQTPEPTEFSSGDARVTALRNRPELAQAVAARRARLRQADREYAIGLATVRNAAQLTQAELATVLGVGQAAVAKMERRPDLLLSTLRSYINGAGGHARLVVDFADGGRRVELDLDTIQIPEQEDAPADERSTES